MKKYLFYLCCAAALITVIALCLWESPELYNLNAYSINRLNLNPLADKININTATLNELTMLKGIGKAKATAIIEYRKSNGSFKDINEIKNVKGISENIFSDIEDKIEV